MYGYSWFWIVGGLIVLGLFVALVVVLVLIGVSGGRNRNLDVSQPEREARGGPEDPLEILRWRYARGEITREEYQQMRDDLIR